MSVVMLLLLFLAPVVVAISADLGHFALFVMLVCVIAGLAQPMSGASSAAKGGEKIASTKPRNVHVVGAISAN